MGNMGSVPTPGSFFFTGHEECLVIIHLLEQLGYEFFLEDNSRWDYNQRWQQKDPYTPDGRYRGFWVGGEARSSNGGPTLHWGAQDAESDACLDLETKFY